MGFVRNAAKRDTAEEPIVKILRAAGAYVWRLDRPVDLLVYYRSEIKPNEGPWWVLEVKTPGAALDKRQKVQQVFCQTYGVPIVHTGQQALIAIGAVEDVRGSIGLGDSYDRRP